MSRPVSVEAVDLHGEEIATRGLDVFAAAMDRPRTVPFHRGLAAVFSEPHPEKDGPNEDSAALIRVSDARVVFVVADGVGGMPQGYEASSTAIRALRDAVTEAADLDVSLRAAVVNGLELANQRVMDLGVGAGTTIAIAAIDEDDLQTYHVGDSLVFLVGQRGRRKFETIAHSPVGYAVEAGVLDEHEAMTHEERHLVSNIIGTPEMRIDIGPRRHLAPRDTLLLASDGLFDNLYPDEIVECVRKGPLADRAEALVSRCRSRIRGEAGKPQKLDDVSVVLYRRSR